MFRRVLSFVVLCAVAATYATAAASPAQGTQGSTSMGSGGPQWALCPATRATQHIGRQVEGRSAPPVATPLGLLPEVPANTPPAIAHRIRLLTPSATRLGQFAHQSRITRGPPGRDSKSIES